MDEIYRRSLASIGDKQYYTTVKTGSIAAGDNEVVEITAPAGFYVVPLAVAFLASNPSGASSGLHSLTVYNGSTTPYLGVQVQKTYSSGLNIYYQDYLYVSMTGYPNDRAAFIQALQNIIIKPGEKLTLKYLNSTDVAQTANRNYYLTYVLIPKT